MTPRQKAFLLVAVQLVLLLALAGVLLLLPMGQVGWARLVGVALAAVGLVVVFWALWTHFRVNGSLVNISPEPDVQAQLVQKGLYAHIRHPIYLGVMLCGVGAALAHGHVAALGLALLLVLFFTYKSTFEEKWLMQVYPGYAAYRERAGRFLPRLLK
ncbi:MAG: isoprenylcysteine carboxylmethyltransferase family protein [Chloroflexi bacterium]|nr:isoprenylcysteine carboxylmethyltransferase family protein [Chloroflexota bacterium]